MGRTGKGRRKRPPAAPPDPAVAPTASCPNCAEETSVLDAFCPKCGTMLAEEE